MLGRGGNPSTLRKPTIDEYVPEGPTLVRLRGQPSEIKTIPELEDLLSQAQCAMEAQSLRDACSLLQKVADGSCRMLSPAVSSIAGPSSAAAAAAAVALSKSAAILEDESSRKQIQEIHAEALMQLGVVNHAMGKQAEACGWYDLCVAFLVTEVPNRVGISERIEGKSGKRKNDPPAFAWKNMPADCALVLLNRALASMDIQQWMEARAALLRAKKILEDDPMAYDRMLLAHVLFNLGIVFERIAQDSTSQTKATVSPTKTERNAAPNSSMLSAASAILDASTFVDGLSVSVSHGVHDSNVQSSSFAGIRNSTISAAEEEKERIKWMRTAAKAYEHSFHARMTAAAGSISGAAFLPSDFTRADSEHVAKHSNLHNSKVSTEELGVEALRSAARCHAASGRIERAITCMEKAYSIVFPHKSLATPSQSRPSSSKTAKPDPRKRKTVVFDHSTQSNRSPINEAETSREVEVLVALGDLYAASSDVRHSILAKRMFAAARDLLRVFVPRVSQVQSSAASTASSASSYPSGQSTEWYEWIVYVNRRCVELHVS